MERYVLLIERSGKRGLPEHHLYVQIDQAVIVCPPALSTFQKCLESLFQILIYFLVVISGNSDG